MLLTGQWRCRPCRFGRAYVRRASCARPVVGVVW
jgi:hypothetical protein